MAEPETKLPDENELDSEDFLITVRTEEVKHYDIMLNESVADAYKYAKVFSTLRDLPYNTESVNLYLANYGGYIHGLIPLFNAIRECSVPVDVIVTSNSYSCGALLALAGRSLTMKPNTHLMFHNYSGGEHGKGKELLDAAKAEQENIYDAFYYMAHPFLSKDEIKDICSDHDKYIKWKGKSYGVNIKERIDRHFNAKKRKK